MQSKSPRWRNLASADQVQQRFGRVTNLVQHAAARCSAVAPTAHGAVIAQHRDAMLAAMHDLGGAIHDFMAVALSH